MGINGDGGGRLRDTDDEDDEDEGDDEIEGEDSKRVDGSVETCRTGRATP